MCTNCFAPAELGLVLFEVAINVLLLRSLNVFWFRLTALAQPVRLTKQN